MTRQAGEQRRAAALASRPIVGPRAADESVKDYNKRLEADRLLPKIGYSRQEVADILRKITFCRKTKLRTSTMDVTALLPIEILEELRK